MAQPGSGREPSSSELLGEGQDGGDEGRCESSYSSERVPGRARGRPSPEAAAQIDREILHAARDLFFAHGYESTSMAMIVKAAGVSKTTLYARYATKAELFKASLDLTVDLIQNDQLSPEKRDEQDLVGGLMVFGRDAIMISRLPLWTNYERMVFAEGLRFPELAALVAERIDRGIATVRDFIASACERESKVCDDPETMAMNYVMALRGYYTAAVLRGHVPSVEECDAFVGKLVSALILACRC